MMFWIAPFCLNYGLIVILRNQIVNRKAHVKMDKDEGEGIKTEGVLYKIPA